MAKKLEKMRQSTINKIITMYSQYDFSNTVWKKREDEIEYRCTIHNIVNKTTPENLIGKHGCWQCGVEKRAKNRVVNKAPETLKKLKEMYPEYKFGEYKGATELMDVYCPIHGLQKIRPNDMLNNHGCPACGNERKNEERRLTLEEIEQRSKDYHGDVWDFSISEKPKNEDDRIHIKCKICGEINYKPVLRIMYGKCDYCLMSQGERAIVAKLREMEIEFIPEYSFPDCKYKNPLYFDFYLPKLNTVIEFQGEQHLQFTKHFHGDLKGLEIQKIKDQIKRDYCKEKRIREIELFSLEEVDKLEETLKENFLNAS